MMLRLLLLYFVCCVVSGRDAFLIAQYFRFLQYDGSNCPKETWLIDMHAVDPGRDKLFVDIGFNKGYNFAIWMSLWTPELDINTKSWMNSLTKTMPHIEYSELCGYCKDCQSNMFTLHDSSLLNNNVKEYDSTRSLTMIGLDINPTNIDAVNNITSDYVMNNANSKIFDPTIPSLFTYTVAASGKTGNVSVWDCQGMVIENCKISGNPSRGHSLLAVTLDDFLDSIATSPSMHLEGPASIPFKNDKENTAMDVDTADSGAKFMPAAAPLSEQLSKIGSKFDYKFHSSRVIDMLITDTEGHDAEVLYGAMKHLKQRKVRCIIFEYHQHCPWPKTPLFQLIKDLHVAAGYVCYFEGQGRLFRLTGNHNPLFEIHHWSNVICVQKHDIWYGVLEKYKVTGSEALEALTKANMLNHTFVGGKPDMC